MSRNHYKIAPLTEADCNCMTLIAGKKASSTGQVIVAHDEDDRGHYKVFRGYVPAASWPKGTVLPAEAGHAAIPQAEHTHGFLWSEVRSAMYGLSNSDGYFNDAGVLVVSNSAKVSREDLSDETRLSEGGIEGNLRRVIAERASTAREALDIAIEMVERYGYVPNGRCYTMADKDEAYMIQIVSGKHYMAVRVPDDFVVVMPNHYTLHKLDEFPETWYSADLIEYAMAKGWYTPAVPGSYADFDFAAAYGDEEKMQQSFNIYRARHSFARLTGGTWNEAENGLPFGCRLGRTVTPWELAAVMSDHYEGTADDTLRFGPGRSPHHTPVRRICTDSTVDSVVCEFAAEPHLTRLWTSPGRPCQLPYMPCHPMAGLPEALCSMEDPAAAAASHYLPAPEKMCYRRDIWQRFRDYQNTMDMVYSDVIRGCTDLLSVLREKDIRKSLAAEKEAEALLRSGRWPEAAALLCEADNACILEDLAALEDYGKGHFAVGKAEPLRVAPGDSELTLHFTAPFAPKEDSLLFGLGGMNLRLSYAAAVPGSLQAEADGSYTVRFPMELMWPDLLAEDAYDCLLGGTDMNGKAFAATAMLTVVKA